MSNSDLLVKNRESKNLLVYFELLNEFAINPILKPFSES